MEIKVPTLIIDQKKAGSNIDRMLKKAKNGGAIFRPHFKTHQLGDIGKLFKQRNVKKITVSSVSMASYFVEHGWNNITIAFPINLREIEDINQLASKVKLNVLVESLDSASIMSIRTTQTMGIFIKIDSGYHRTGLLPGDPEIDKILQLLDSNKLLIFRGFLSHAGNTYTAESKSEIRSIMEDNKTCLNKLKQKYIDHYPEIIISYGDTPSCSLADDCTGFDEIRPGNFVYYDVMQYHIGSCSINDIAVAVACPVVAVHASRNELVIYGGAIHLSKEFIAPEKSPRFFGYIVNLTDEGWSNPIQGAYVSALSQEHGVIKMKHKDLMQYKPGAIIGVLPIHSCLAANLLRTNYQLINN